MLHSTEIPSDQGIHCCQEGSLSQALRDPSPRGQAYVKDAQALEIRLLEEVLPTERRYDRLKEAA
jgi:hypothetical protein